MLVSRSNHIDKDVTEHLADNGQLSLSPETSLRRTVHKAGKNETVASIAKRFRVSADSVAEWNKVGTAAYFKPGQQVVLFLPAPARSSAKAARHGSAKVAKTGKSKSRKGRSARVAQR